MAKGILDLLQNRAEAVFLPVISFGYIYSEYDSLATCESITILLPATGLPPITFLWLALIGTIIASYMYGLNENPNIPQGVEDVLGLSTFVSVIQISLMIISFVELSERVCSGDIIVLGLTCLYLSLVIIRITEKTRTQINSD